MIYVSALASREIRAIILALKQAEPEIRKEANNRSKLVITEIWRQELAEQAAQTFGKQQKARVKVLVDTAKAGVGNSGPYVSSATTGRPLRGGFDIKTQYAGMEFGARSNVRTFTSTSKLGKKYKVTRDVAAQLDSRKKTGYVVWPAAAAASPRILSMWIQTAVRTMAEILEGR